MMLLVLLNRVCVCRRGGSLRPQEWSQSSSSSTGVKETRAADSDPQSPRNGLTKVGSVWVSVSVAAQFHLQWLHTVPLGGCARLEKLIVHHAVLCFVLCCAVPCMPPKQVPAGVVCCAVLGTSSGCSTTASGAVNHASSHMHCAVTASGARCKPQFRSLQPEAGAAAVLS